MKKKLLIRIILIILILCWMRIVFGLSSDNAEQSSSLSLTIARWFSKKEEVLMILEPVIRKIAHLSEYTLGGFLFYGFFLTFCIKPKRQVIFAGIMGILYAISDEVHQLFVRRKSWKSRRCCN